MTIIFPCNQDLIIRYFISLFSSHKGLPRWSYVILLVSSLSSKLLLLVTFSTTVIWLPFDGYQIIWVYWGCLGRDAFCTPLIVAETSWFYLGITLCVVTEAVVLVVYFSCYAVYLPHIFYLDISVYAVEYPSWVATIILSHTTWWDCLCQSHFNFDLYFLFLVLHGLLYYPYRDLLCLQIGRLCLLLLLYQLIWPAVSVHTFLLMAGFLGNSVI